MRPLSSLIVAPQRQRRTCLVSVAVLGLLGLNAPLASGQPYGPPPGYQGTGSWKIKVIPNGNLTISTNYGGSPSGTSTVPWWMWVANMPDGTPVYVSPLGTGFSLNFRGEGSASISTSGSFTVEMTYVGPDGRPTVPPPGKKNVYILENLNANWTTGPQNADGSGQASNGIHPEQNCWLWEGHGHHRGGVSSGQRLRKWDGSSGTISFTSPGMSANASVSAQAGKDVGVAAYVGYSVQEDPRAVVIKADALEYPDGNWRREGENRVRNNRNPDGSITVDSSVYWGTHLVFQYVPNPDGTMSPLPNPLTLEGWAFSVALEAVPTGFPTDYFAPVSVDWSTEGVGILNRGFLNLAKWGVGLEQLHEQMLPRNTFPGEVSSKVKVKVEDRRTDLEATEENTFTIRWHTPYEKWERHGAIIPNILQGVVLDVANPGYASVNGSVLCKWFYNEWLEAAIWEGTGQILGVIGDGTTNWMERSPAGLLSSLCATLGLAATSFGPKPDEGSPSFYACWNQPAGTPPGARSTFSPDKNEQAMAEGRYKMYPRLFLNYDIYPYRGEHYGANGFQGFVKHGLAKKNGLIWAGDFVREDGDFDGGLPDK